MTATERAAFEKLYKTFKTQGQERSKDGTGEHEELDQIADEYYEEDEDGSKYSLDTVFATVLEGAPPSKDAQDATPDTPQSKKKAAAKAEKDRIKKLRTDERHRIDKVLESAQTDQELWKTLEREVFAQLRKLDLDAPQSNKKAASKRKAPDSKQKPADPTAVDTRILFPNYPHHLTTAIHILRTHFPSSPLPFTILSTTKSLGRSSHALGATTKLYRQLIRTAWLQQSSYSLIDMLLTDMDTNIIEFDLGILELLDAVIKEHATANSGALGRELKMVHDMEMWVEGIKKIQVWRGVVAERLGVQPQKQGPGRRVLPPAGEHEESGNDRGGAVRRPARDGAVPWSRGASDAIPFVVGQSLEDGSLEDLRDGRVSQDTDAERPVEQAIEEEASEHDVDVPAKVLL
jgi:hypothetical protein